MVIEGITYHRFRVRYTVTDAKSKLSRRSVIRWAPAAHWAVESAARELCERYGEHPVVIISVRPHDKPVSMTRALASFVRRLRDARSAADKLPPVLEMDQKTREQIGKDLCWIAEKLDSYTRGASSGDTLSCAPRRPTLHLISGGKK